MEKLIKNDYYTVETKDRKLFESSYHTMILVMSVWLTSEYEIISNRETGSGRCDIILKAKKALSSYIIEFKYSKDKKELEKAVEVKWMEK